MVKCYATRRLARIARKVLIHRQGWHTTVRRVSVIAVVLCLAAMNACTRPCTSVYVDVLDSEYQLGMEQLQASQAEGYTCHAGSPILGGTQYVCTICS